MVTEFEQNGKAELNCIRKGRSFWTLLGPLKFSPIWIDWRFTNCAIFEVNVGDKQCQPQCNPVRLGSFFFYKVEGQSFVAVT